jgi:hypothetical protein
MMKKTHICLFVTAALIALSAVSCIYPFTPEAQDGSGAFVIEGDILLGDYTNVKLSFTAPVDAPNTASEPPSCDVWVEDDAGTHYEGIMVPSSPGNYRVDTRNASLDRSYRLHVVRHGGNEYISDWGKAQTVPEIDSLSYNLDFERSRLNVALSMHSRGGSFFKWSYVEKWEYHADYYAEIRYIPPSSYIGWGSHNDDGRIEALPYTETPYFCYDSAPSTEIMIFSTERQTDDRFVDLEFRPIPRDDLRISYRYHIDVYLEPLSEDAYRYWETVKANSEYNGNLFAPNPSELIGNIRCVQDPKEMVMGYISVAAQAHKDLIILNSEARFYKDSHPYEEPLVVNRGDWYKNYRDGYLPYSYYEIPGDVSQTYWARARCVDCRIKGKGTTTRPDDWPI